MTASAERGMTTISINPLVVSARNALACLPKRAKVTGECGKVIFDVRNECQHSTGRVEPGKTGRKIFSYSEGPRSLLEAECDNSPDLLFPALLVVARGVFLASHLNAATVDICADVIWCKPVGWIVFWRWLLVVSRQKSL